MIWLEVLYVPFAFEDTEIVHEGVDILTETLRDRKWTHEWFCQLGAKMLGAIGRRIGSFPN
jgi:L-fucose isomerase-like protein